MAQDKPTKPGQNKQNWQATQKGQNVKTQGTKQPYNQSQQPGGQFQRDQDKE